MHGFTEQPVPTSDVPSEAAAQVRPVHASMPKIVLWAILSYPLSFIVGLGVVFLVGTHHSPFGGGSAVLIILSWGIVSLGFGVAYFRYAHCKDFRRFVILMAANVLALIITWFGLALFCTTDSLLGVFTSLPAALTAPRGLAIGFLQVTLMTLVPSFVIGTGLGFLSWK